MPLKMKNLNNKLKENKNKQKLQIHLIINNKIILIIHSKLDFNNTVDSKVQA